MSSDQRHRFLRANSLWGEQALMVLSISGSDYLSHLFEFWVKVVPVSKHDVLNELLGTPLAVMIGDVYRQGVVTAVEQDVSSGQCRLRLQPWLSLLKSSSHCRIFHRENVIDIVRFVCHQRGFYDLETSQLTRSYSPLPFVTQYQESDFNFVSRLLQQAGIFYYFEYTKQKHVLHLIDRPTQAPLLKKVSAKLVSADNDKASAFTARSTDQALSAGVRVQDVEGAESTVCWLTECQIDAVDNTYYTWADNQDQRYANFFHAIRSDSNYQVPLSAQKPVLSGLQQATVIAAGYPVKVRFHWEQSDQKNEAYLSVGHQQGHCFVPRVGQEVWVSFQQGDPDRPRIVGAAYNTLSQPPYTFPDEQMTSGIKTQAHELSFVDEARSPAIQISAKHSYQEWVSQNLMHEVQQQLSTTVKAGDYQSTVEGSHQIEAKQGICLQVGKSVIQLDSEGMRIQAPKVDIYSADFLSTL